MKKLVCFCLVTGLWFIFNAVAWGTTFSIDPFSPVPGVSSADLLKPGPIGGPPTVVIPATALGLLPVDDINAVSFGPFMGQTPYFSVDNRSVGVPGTAVAVESAAGQQAGDIYADPNFANTNVLAKNQDALGLLPPDNLNALDMDSASVADTNGDGIPDGPVYLSLAPGSPTLSMIGATPADILMSVGGGPPMVVMPCFALGLLPQDDIDALVVDALLQDYWFSLSPGSPSLFVQGFSAANVFLNTFGMAGVTFGPGFPLATSTSLGLAFHDNLDGFSDQAAVPIPGALWLLGSGLIGLAALRTKLRP